VRSLSWHELDERKSNLTKPSERQDRLDLTEGTDPTSISVPHIACTDTFRTLGARLSPGGATKGAREFLPNLAVSFAQKISSSTLSRQDAYWTFMVYFQPPIKYSIPTITISREDCNHIQSPALCAILSKLHLNRHTTRSIVFGHTIYGGLNLPELYTTQGIGQVQLFVEHLSLDN
jgi:hypothetical protein